MDEEIMREFEQFREWKRTRHTPLIDAFNDLDLLLNARNSRRIDGVMAVGAFEVLARALICLRAEVENGS